LGRKVFQELSKEWGGNSKEARYAGDNRPAAGNRRTGGKNLFRSAFRNKNEKASSIQDSAKDDRYYMHGGTTDKSNFPRWSERSARSSGVTGYQAGRRGGTPHHQRKRESGGYSLGVEKFSSPGIKQKSVDAGKQHVGIVGGGYFPFPRSGGISEKKALKVDPPIKTSLNQPPAREGNRPVRRKINRGPGKVNKPRGPAFATGESGGVEIIPGWLA